MESTENLIIHAALKLFSSKGYAATSIRDLAKETKLTSSTLYYYVKSKKDLLVLIMEKYLKMLIAEAKKELNEFQKPHEQLETLIRVHVINHGMQQLPALVVDTEYRSLEGEDRENVRALRREYEKMWQNVLQAGLEAGLFQFKDVKITSYALLEMCTGVAHWFRENKRYSIEEIADQFVQLGFQMVNYHG